MTGSSYHQGLIIIWHNNKIMCIIVMPVLIVVWLTSNAYIIHMIWQVTWDDFISENRLLYILSSIVSASIPTSAHTLTSYMLHMSDICCIYVLQLNIYWLPLLWNGIRLFISPNTINMVFLCIYKPYYYLFPSLRKSDSSQCWLEYQPWRNLRRRPASGRVWVI